ncbi:hypothetical protein [Nonomuraea cavernae]|uniref:Uncharacterized protein n=1 Tax=Nonomuraea cavernae TaxID=2045107 RepID=A0A918DRP7_9ACTN|nr:hypothetical protein [Nonomuraea cavernae]MCA2186393.1 hypothetical protein [Nonomuraea cavernae]GGO79259.1 hypothetical protein GCM10012289_63140 [Nonomuraea cavernae]
MFSRKIGRRTAVVVALVGLAMSPAAVANAQTASAALACGGPTAKTPWKVGTNIWGEGFAGSCAGDYRIFVERSRYYGWETMAASQWIKANEGTVVTYNCSGTGTHTFRSAVWKSGTGIIKTSGTFRTSC